MVLFALSERRGVLRWSPDILREPFCDGCSKPGRVDVPVALVGELKVWKAFMFELEYCGSSSMRRLDLRRLGAGAVLARGQQWRTKTG